MLVIKTGMVTEQSIAQKYAAPGTLVLTGVGTTADELEKMVPEDCTALLSLGVCGGLSPQAQIGQAFIYDAVVFPNGRISADAAWVKRLFDATHYYERRCWSSGLQNTANTESQRAQILAQTGCWIIDDETIAVAEVAMRRGLRWCGLRTVSDGTQNNLPPAVLNALNPDGTDNIWEIVQSVASDPSEIPLLLQTAVNAKRSFDELDTACIQAGPKFQAL
jgi:nucleoside phosphorylase